MIEIVDMKYTPIPVQLEEPNTDQLKKICEEYIYKIWNGEEDIIQRSDVLFKVAMECYYGPGIWPRIVKRKLEDI